MRKSLVLVIFLFLSPSCLTYLPQEGVVTYVFDGDTIQVDKQKVRLIGVDTPEREVRDQGIREECFAWGQATRFMKGLLGGQKVFLRVGPQTPEKDRYGRWLAYVYLGSRLVNAELIEKGYGFAMPQISFSKKDKFMDLQKEAKNKKKGLWGKCEVICTGEVCKTTQAL